MSEDDEHSREIQRLRDETPGASHVVHFNNAGCSLPPRPVIDAQVAYLEQEGLVGGYEAAAQFASNASEFYTCGADILGCLPDEIGFCQSATDAWRRVMYALPLRTGSTIAFDESIFGGNLLALADGRDRFGWQLRPIDLGESGAIDLSLLARVLREESVDLVAISHMPAQSGVLNPIGEIAQMAARAGSLTLVDACQTLGQAPLDVKREGIDGLIFTGRKYLRGPRGTGGYFVRGDLAADMVPLGPDIQVAEITNSALDWQLRPDAPRLEQWERSWSGFAGAAAALKYLSDLDGNWIWTRITSLAEMVVASLKAIKGVVVRRWAAELGGIVVFDLPGRDLVAARDRLRTLGVNVMFAGPQNAPIEMLRRGERGWLRASAHYYNTEEDVEHLAAAISDYLSDESG